MKKHLFIFCVLFGGSIGISAQAATISADTTWQGDVSVTESTVVNPGVKMNGCCVRMCGILYT